ncbi:cation:proton antiporter [Cutibacterium porci]|uniref:cation:proton antiporter n=1 Tax=Cutibacterium porci TaxID=2605781 RepID=UPI003899287E
MICVTVGKRFGLPYPILMMLASIVLTFIPGFTVPVIDPDLILELFLPPLLFATARNTSWSVFRKRWHLLLAMAVGLTTLTAFLAALTLWWVVPGVTFTLALVAGAAVAPPDPVAVEAVSGSARIPRQIMMLLQSEGLFNDAVAIVIFQTSLAAVEAGRTSISPTIILDFLLGALVAVAVGLMMGYLYRVVDKLTPDVAARVIVSVVTPFAAYLIAEHLHASGVIAVVVAALETNRRARAEDSETRIARSTFWEIANLLVTGIAFGLIGLQMRNVFTGGDDIRSYLVPVTVLVIVLFAVRFLFVLTMGRLIIKTSVRKFVSSAVLLTWSGMRGLATLALALALPEMGKTSSGMDERHLVVVLAASVIFVTLVPTGLTLPWLSRKLVPPQKTRTIAQIAQIVRTSQHAAVKAVEEEFPHDSFADELNNALERRFETLREELKMSEQIDAHDNASSTAAVGEGNNGSDENSISHRTQHYQRMMTVALDAACEAVLHARSDIDVDPELADRVLRILDQRMMVVTRRD